MVDWNSELKPLLKLYKNRRHPLEYGNAYQLLVMVVLSAQDSDRHINGLAPGLFARFPDMKSLAKADEAEILHAITGVRGARRKAQWLKAIAGMVKQDSKIPRTLDELTQLPGIGRKSANVILRELGAKAEGIMVDLHVVRVAPRLGLATGSDPKKIEQQMMDLLDRRLWSDAGMALSYLGRETCRPTKPQHDQCVMRDVCAYCHAHCGQDSPANASAPAATQKAKARRQRKTSGA
ncbi:MAG: endonuclease III domain-containing protein [Gammaproteobacteria bacterium]